MKSKIPTLLAIFILTVAIVSVVFTISQIQTITSNADVTAVPEDVKITNVKDTSLTVSWLTEKPTIGFVEYTTSNQTKQSAPTTMTTTHFVSLQNLDPGSTYSLRVNSTGTFFDNSGIAWKAQTKTQNNTSNSEIISGKVVNADNFPAKNSIVYVTAAGLETQSTIVTESGNWIMAIPQLPENTILQILIESSTSVVSSATTDLKSANPLPTMTLGNSYDFSNQNIESSPETPNAPITLP